MKPYYNGSYWVCQYYAKRATNGKREVVYFKTLEEAEADIESRENEREEHGRAKVTAAERQWILFARNQLDGDLEKLPEVLAHWKSTGSGSITPTIVEDAVKKFKAFAYQRITRRTQIDIQYRLKSFTESFPGRHLHSIHSAEIETWLASFQNQSSAAAMYKRVGPLMKFAIRHRMIAENPMDRLAPLKPGKPKRAVYSPEDFARMVEWAHANSFRMVLPALAIGGLCFTRTSELIRTYKSEEVLRWNDFLTKRKILHIRAEVSKTRERFTPYGEPLERMLHTHLSPKSNDRVIDVLHKAFSQQWQKMHSDLDISVVKNGLRKSCISYWLAANPDAGIAQVARWAGNSESVVKRHYWELISPEDGIKWFETPTLF